MRLTVSVADLKSALEIARAIVNPKAEKAQACVLLEAHPDGGLTLTAWNERVRARRTVGGVIEQDGTVCLSPAPLSGFVDALTGTDVLTIAVSKTHRAVLTCGASEIKVTGYAAEDFPVAPDVEQPLADCQIAPELLWSLIAAVGFAAETKPDSPSGRTGIHLVGRAGTLTVETAAYNRAARRVVALDGVPDLDVLVPASVLQMAASKLSGATAARLVVTPSALLLETDVGQILIRRIEGDFPDVSRIIPTTSTARVTVDRATLLRALRVIRNVEQVAIGHRGDLEIRDGELELSASDRAADHEARTTIPITLDGEPLHIAVTASHLADAAEAMFCDEITITMNGASRPLLVTGVSAPGSAHILMPILSGSAT